MILFYTKKDVTNDAGIVLRRAGDVFATIDGRVHGIEQLNSFVNDGMDERNIGKYIIGWIENGGERMAYNIDKFDLMQEFESVSPVSPLDFRVDIESGQLLKRDNLVQEEELQSDASSADNEHPKNDAPINV